MNDIKTVEHHNEYNDIPVIYCSECLSLKISTVDGIDYCEQCGSTDMKEANIFDWEKIYEDRYSEKYLNIKENGKEVRTKE